MTYTFCVVAGVALAAAARRLWPPPPQPHSAALLLVAAIGAVFGSLLLELPADLLGWTAGIASETPHAPMMGGRTLLGGLLGGWFAVEAAKPALGIRAPTGDGFALPLAVALASGRLGCAFTGCCAGRPIPDSAWLGALAWRIPDGVARYPTSLAEVAFHLSFAGWLVAARSRGWLRGRQFALYVAAYGIVRFALEPMRENPTLALGLTYYQWLSIPLAALGLGQLAWRSLPVRDGRTRIGARPGPLRGS